MLKHILGVLLLVLVLSSTGCASTEELSETSDKPTGQLSETSDTPTGQLPEKPQGSTAFRVLTLDRPGSIGQVIYSEGFFTIYRNAYGESTQRYCFMRADGVEITDFIFDYAYPFSEGLACVRQGDKCGFIDTEGNIAIPLIYDNATPFLEGLAYFEIGDTFGFMNQSGDTAFLLDCDSVSSFQEGFALFSIDGKYGYIDSTGKVAIEAVFDDAGYFVGGFSKVRVGSKFALIDTTGAFITDPIYDDVAIEGDYFRASLNGKIGVLNKKGEVVVPFEYDSVNWLSGHEAVIHETGEGTTLIRFDGTSQKLDIPHFLPYRSGNDMIISVDEGKYGYVSVADFSIAIPCRYDRATDFVGEYAAVMLDDTWGVIDRQGNTIIPFDGNYKKVFDNGTVAVSHVSGHKLEYQLVDINGNLINDAIFNHVEQSGDGYMVGLDGRYGFLDAEGKEDIPLTYAYCSKQVFGTEDCYVARSGYWGNVNCIVVPGELQETDLSYILMRNEVTPRIKPYNQFIRSLYRPGLDENDAAHSQKGNKGVTPDYIHYYKLYQIDSAAPVLYYYGYPLTGSSFPLSNSGFYATKDGELIELMTGYECGGSWGGDCICFWRDQETHEVYLGKYSHHGGFGGNSSGGEVYEYIDGSATLLVSFEQIRQSAKNYKESELLENPHLFYDSNNVPYTEESMKNAIRDNVFIASYLVNGERVTNEAYREVAERLTIHKLWWWSGY